MAIFDWLFGDRRRWRVMRQLVNDRERLAAMSEGSAARPIELTSASVVEVRVRALTCPQCEGTYRQHDHRALGAGLRAVDVTCRLCGVPRSLWFRISSREPN
jgi:hypothetical protein